MHVIMPRLLLLLFMLSFTTMLFIARCGFNMDIADRIRSPVNTDSGVAHMALSVRDTAGPYGALPVEHPSQYGVPGIPYAGEAADGEHQKMADGGGDQILLKRYEEQHQQEITYINNQHHQEVEQLKRQIETLQIQVSKMKEALNQTTTTSSSPQAKPAEKKPLNGSLESSAATRAKYYETFIISKVNASEISAGVVLHNEYELVPFCRFTLNRIYLVDPGMGKRVMEKPIGFKKRDLQEIISYGVEQLNKDRTKDEELYSVEYFMEGIYRTEPSLGSHYELYFEDIDTKLESTYKRVVVTRPYAPLQAVKKEDVSTRTELINVILPLSGRTEKFQSFMKRFVQVCIENDKRVYLTVVYFGKEGLDAVKNTINNVKQEHNFQHITLVTLNEEFSRGRGLQVGVQSWERGDVLMFMCDVDIVFTAEFLERCRFNASPGTRVYYPMVFSLYNPTVVYALHGLQLPKPEEQLVISKDTGFWRDFGFGMTCQYRSDFLAIHGFDEQITGWGMEDVLLYRKYVKSRMMVVRATDPGIFHVWHEKHCGSELSWEQYRGCIRSKALNEASHAQLGMLAFKDEVSVRRNRKTPT